MSTEEKSLSLPARVQVTLKAGFILALANIVCVAIFAWAWMHVRAEAKVISVTGSAKKQITSDLVTWRANVSANAPDLKAAYAQLEASVERARKFIADKGIPVGQVTVSPVATERKFKRDEKGNYTDQVSSYELHQSIAVSSGDVDRVTDVAMTVTDLIKDGILLDSAPPQYLYTKLADLKVEMLAGATRDATTRAQQIATSSNAALGAIIEAKMGVMQINAVHSTDVSSLGNSDTSSREKEITAVVTARFLLD